MKISGTGTERSRKKLNRRDHKKLDQRYRRGSLPGRRSPGKVKPNYYWGGKGKGSFESAVKKSIN